jgi:lauroyl/myristoyl acyltransferase
VLLRLRLRFCGGTKGCVLATKITRTPATRLRDIDQTTDRPAPSREPLRSHLPRVEFRREERREIVYWLAVFTAIALSWTMRLLPEQARDWLARRGGDLTFRYAKKYRDNVLDNLRHVLGPSATTDELNRAARGVFRVNAENFRDLLLVPHLSPDAIKRRVHVVDGDWSILDSALAKGNGVVLITAHLGAFDFVGQALHQHGYRLTTVTGRTTSRFLFDAVTFLRRSHAMPIVEASPSGVRKVIQALRRGEIAVFLTDRDFFLNGRPVRFFGDQTTLPPGAVRIARDTGAMIVPMFTTRQGGHHALSIEPAFEVQKTDDVEADIARGLETVVQVLERAIGRAPEQWVMFQRVWPSVPAEPACVVPAGSSAGGGLLRRVAAVRARWSRNGAARRGSSPREEMPKDRTASPPQSSA